tara:strand:+ start:4989 stop:5627 length:639 start_codon:yes stop_codon:yes gene_type:complete
MKERTTSTKRQGVIFDVVSSITDARNRTYLISQNNVKVGHVLRENLYIRGEHVPTKEVKEDLEGRATSVFEWLLRRHLETADPKPEKQFEIEVKARLGAQFIDDVLTVAVEGGINYWAAVHKISNEGNGSSCYKEVVVFDNESDDDDRELLSITPEVAAKGISLILGCKVKCCSRIRASISDAVFSNDCGHIDAEGADCIVQAGLFATIVYG